MKQQIPDDVLIDAARMFYPDVSGTDSYTVCAAALQRLREMDHVEGRENSKALAKWRASDPVSIAYYAMMFFPPQPAGMQLHHAWHARLMKLRTEREQRFFGKAGGCHGC